MPTKPDPTLREVRRETFEILEDLARAIRLTIDAGDVDLELKHQARELAQRICNQVSQKISNLTEQERGHR